MSRYSNENVVWTHSTLDLKGGGGGGGGRGGGQHVDRRTKEDEKGQI